MSRRLLWQAALALVGIGLLFGVLYRLTSKVETVVDVPATGGTYVEGVVGAPYSVNPILAWRTAQNNAIDQDLSALLFDGLTSLDATGQVTPCLATAWTVSADATVYEFTLRHDVTWHDGAPFMAADVAFTVQAIQDPNFQGDAALHNLWRSVTVEVLDNARVRFTLAEPFPSFLYYTTIGLLPAHLLSDVPAADLPTDDFSTKQPVGTGMFRAESISPDRAVLVANPDFWGRRPFMERLEFWFFGDEDALLASYERGEIQGFHPSQAQTVSDLAKLRDLQLYSAEYAGYEAIFLNLNRDTLPFFRTSEVRQALLYALDRDGLIDQFLGGSGLVADSPIPPMSWANDPSLRHYGYDPVRAIGLLDASGWVDSDADRIRDKDGVPLAFGLVVDDDVTTVKIAEEIARQWHAIGVDVTVRPTAGDQVLGLVRSRDFDAVLTEVGLTADPDPYPMWHSTQVGEGGQNFSGFRSVQADLALEAGRATGDPERRARAYSTFQQIFAEQVPSLLLYYPMYTYAVDSQVREVQLAPLLQPSDRFRNIADWYATTKIVVSATGQLDKSENQ